jgi:hypothetical protein
MMQVAKTRSKLLGMLLGGIASVGFAAGASAVDVGVGANVGVQAPNVGVQTQGNAGASTGGAHVDGGADARMKTQDKLNRNDQKLPEATRGMERAQERMNEAGAEHEQATAVGAKSKKHAKKKHKEPASYPAN